MRKNWGKAILLVLIFVTSIHKLHVFAANCDETIDEQMASKIAQKHIQSVIQLNKDQDTSNWHWGMHLGTPLKMYDLTEKISAYCFEVFDELDEDCGYVVVGANNNYAPIIEYNFKDKFYPSVEAEKRGATRVLYLGGVDYYIYANEELYDVSDFGSVKSNSELCATNNLIESAGEFEKEWQGWREVLSLETGGSNPPTSGSTPITNPGNYETGYSSAIAQSVVGLQNITFRSMSNFSGYSEHCAPTAATNIMLYWYVQNSINYGSLCKNNDYTWNDTFVELHTLMGTDDTNGTLNANLQSAYTTYLTNAGFSPTVTYRSSPGWLQLETEINDGYPFHMVVQGHYYYGNHSVVGLGYIEYKYGLFSYSRYVRVADGWSNSCNRYIHFTTGNSSVQMVQVRPN
ncbi:MAG: C39 family peptidase [Lachnospiraceae bacterium]|nr:C39 family peptidase [Lachnospiraceae bacterium]